MMQRVMEDDLKKPWSSASWSAAVVGGMNMNMNMKQGRIDIGHENNKNNINNNNNGNNRHRFAYNMDYHLNMLSASQENFEKSSAYNNGAYFPLKHLVSKDFREPDDSKLAKRDELCIVPSYPWSSSFNNKNNINSNNSSNTNNMSCAELSRNLILSGLAANHRNRNFNFNLATHPNNNSHNDPAKVKAMMGGGGTIVPAASLKSIFSPTESERIQLEKRVLPATADEAFQKNQLAPLVFLKNPLWSNLVPSNFVARAWSCFLTLPCEAYFFIEPKKEKGLFSTRHYVATVTGPSNCICPFQMRVEADEHGKEIRYAYMFRPCEEGVYTVKVRLAAHGSPHISESPLSIQVCPSPETFKQQQQQVQQHQTHFQQPQQQHWTSPIRPGTGNGPLRPSTQNNSNNNKNNMTNISNNNANNNNNNQNNLSGKNKGRIGPYNNNSNNNQSQIMRQAHSGSGNFLNFQ